MIFNQLKEELGLLESLDFKKVNTEQRKMLKNEYNLHTTGFEYAEDDWGNVIFVSSREAFKNLEYYLGLEYERETIEYKLEFNNKIIVSYSGSNRAEELLIQLEKIN